MKIWLEKRKISNCFRALSMIYILGHLLRNEPSMSSNNLEIDVRFLKLRHFSRNLRHNKGTFKNHIKQFPILTEIEPVLKDIQFRQDLKFPGDQTKSSNILVTMKLSANQFLVACTQLYTLPCRSVGRYVGHVFKIMTFYGFLRYFKVL